MVVNHGIQVVEGLRLLLGRMGRARLASVAALLLRILILLLLEAGRTPLEEEPHERIFLESVSRMSEMVAVECGGDNDGGDEDGRGEKVKSNGCPQTTMGACEDSEGMHCLVVKKTTSTNKLVRPQNQTDQHKLTHGAHQAMGTRRSSTRTKDDTPRKLSKNTSIKRNNALSQLPHDLLQAHPATVHEPRHPTLLLIQLELQFALAEGNLLLLIILSLFQTAG